MKQLPAAVGILLAAVLSPAAAAVGPGELLFAELNCVACHDAPATVRARLASRTAPRLGAAGARVTPQWLQGFLSSPNSGPTSTPHPDALHALPAGERTAAADALTHFLVSLQPPDKAAQSGYSIAAVNSGRALYHSLGCVACHAPQETSEKSPLKPGLDELARLSTPLGDLARKFAVADLSAFLKDPLRSHPSGRMPSLKLTDGEARAISTYLLRAQAPAGPASKLAGLSYEYFDKSVSNLADLEKLMPSASGNTEAFTVAVAPRKNGFGLRFRGVLDVPKDGDYTFYTESDDGSRLYLDEKLIVDNDGIHPQLERSGKVTLKAGEHAIAVGYFDGGGNVAFKVQWKGPGIGKQEIPAARLSHEGQPMRPLGEVAFTVDGAKANAGNELFAKLNCAACHQPGPARKSKPLQQLAGSGGCLAPNPPGDAPRYALSATQRAELSAMLAGKAELSAPLAPAEQVKRTIAQLNCIACHERDGQGGPAGVRREYFVSTMDADLGDEGVMPPRLTAVGAKLQPSWMKSVLTEGGAVRPYMATRMPQFGEANVAHLQDAFEQADARPDARPQPNNFAPGAAEAANKHGRRLVGTTGLSCIACHTFAGNKSLGVPALDLSTIGQRLKWDWFRRYLLDPASLRPGTRMPQFWPEGVAVGKDILGGNTEQQIAAIWFYLARKNFTDLPTGLLQAKLAIVATNEPVIYRNFIQDAGARAIAVGYPEKANLAFDANDVRLALIWQGEFIDAARHRTGRGVGYEPPLGHGVVKLPPGAPFAVLASESDAWPKEAGKAAGYQFKGYTLDERQRPSFRYAFGQIEFDDVPIPVPGEVDAGFRRTLTLRAPSPVSNLYFRAAVGKIEEKPDGSFLVDEKVRLRFTGAKATIRRNGDKSELLVPISFKGNEARLVEEVSW